MKNKTVEQLIKKALSYQKKGDFLEAKAIYQQILKVFPKNVRAQEALTGLIKVNQNKSFTLPPQQLVQQLIELLNKGQFFNVMDQAKVITNQYPNAFFVWNIYGISAAQMKMFDEAVIAFKKSISIKPDIAETYNNLGNVYREKRELEKSIKIFQKAILIEPDYASAYNNMAVAFSELNKFKEAVQACKKAISLNPKDPSFYNNLGNVFKEQIKLHKAIEAYKKAIFIKPDYAEAYSNMGIAFKSLGELDEAIKSFKKSILLNPNLPSSFNNMGNALLNQGKLNEAIDAYKKSISLQPNKASTHFNLSFVFLNNDQLKEGFDKYEWRWKTPKFSSQQRFFSQPMWDGKKSLSGKRILVWSEQGVGDTIMWVSCLSYLASQANKCILECQNKLLPLLKRSFPNVEVKAEEKSKDKDRNDFDFHLPLGSLYGKFIKEISINFKPKAYLFPDPTRVMFWKKRLKALGKGPYVGISWKSGDMSHARLPNYCEISELYSIFSIPNIIFINLQYVKFKEDLKKIKDNFGVTIHNFDDLDHFNNIDDVAALCKSLDMVVSTKTTVPLISTAVGTSTKVANWKQSPWNNILLNPRGPSIDIYEKNTRENWDNVFNSIAEDILKLQME